MGTTAMYMLLQPKSTSFEVGRKRKKLKLENIEGTIYEFEVPKIDWIPNVNTRFWGIATYTPSAWLRNKEYKEAAIEHFKEIKRRLE